MNNAVLQKLIYNQLFAASNYELVATIAPTNETKTKLINYASDCRNNATYLERIYQEQNTSSYNPIVEKAQFHGNFIESVKWILNYEGDSNRLFFIQSFYDIYTASQRQILSYIAGIANNHAIGLTHMIFTN